MDPYFLDLTCVKLAMGIIIGLVLGSFTTMLSYRLPRKMSIVKPRSTCPSCKATLQALDLIPVFSWLLSGSKCRHCKSKIGGRYVAIELVTTALTASAFVLIGFEIALLPALALILAFVTMATIKLESF